MRNDSAFPTEASADVSVQMPPSDREEKVLEYARTHGTVTRNDVIGLLEVSASTSARILKNLVKRNLLKRNGNARSTKYTIVK